jgi:hypothetical protein
MKYYPVLILFTMILAGVMGCAQIGTGPSPAQPDNRTVTAATGGNGTSENGPIPAPTIDRALLPMIPYKDTPLRIAFYVPEDWSVSTRQLQRPLGAEGMVYRTDLLDNRFYILTYTVSRGEDQGYRDEIRRTWIPAPEETTVVIHGITYDRFESSLAGTTNVSYVVRKSSANELGYASVLFFTTKGSDPEELSEFTRVVSSFHYFTGKEADTTPGTEIS